MKLNELPREMLSLIGNKLNSASDLIAAQSSCKALHNIDMPHNAWENAYARHPWTIAAPKYNGPHSYKALFVQRVRHERSVFKQVKTEARRLQWENASLSAQRGTRGTPFPIPNDANQQRLHQNLRILAELEKRQEAFKHNFAKARLQLEPTFWQSLTKKFKSFFSY